MDWNPVWADAIANNESGGRYDLLGPVTKNGDQAYGKYQVMGNNVGDWTEQALGKRLSPKEFLADPAAQDAVFKYKFGSYVDKYGTPEDAASAWFSGRPLSQAGNSKDVLGTTVPAYVQKFSAYMGNPTPVQPSPSPFALKVGQTATFGQNAPAATLAPSNGPLQVATPPVTLPQVQPAPQQAPQAPLQVADSQFAPFNWQKINFAPRRTLAFPKG